MAYVIGFVVLILVLSILWKLIKNVLAFILGLAFIGGIIFALIIFGPAILAGIMSILALIWPFLLWGFLAILVLGILVKIYEKIKSSFKYYPWQTTIIVVVMMALLSIVIISFIR